jgi:hypothetical protein
MTDPIDSISGENSTDSRVDETGSKPGPVDFGRLMAGALALILLILGGAAVLMLQPEGLDSGQPLASSGDITANIVMKDDGTQSLVLRNSTTDVTEVGADGAFVQFQPTARPADLDGDGIRDLAIYGWTGGMACCFTHFVFKGSDGSLLGSFEQSGNTPAQLVRLAGSGGAVLIVSSTGSEPTAQGSALEPFGTFLVSWNRELQRLALDRGLMKATSLQTPAPFWATQDPVAQAVSGKTGSESFHPPQGILGRGEVASAYAQWFDALTQAMVASASGTSLTTDPIRRFLDEATFKGQFSAGVQAVRAAAAKPADAAPAEAGAPEVAPGEQAARPRPDIDQLVANYRRDLQSSPWIDDLDRLNDGALKASGPSQPK